MSSISEILAEELSQLKEDIIVRHEQSGQVASGKTKATFENRLTSERSGELLGAGYSGVLERGRKPGKIPKDFVQILKNWAVAKKISFSREEDFNRWANAVAWKIKNEGTKLYRSSQIEDIFTTPLEKFNERIIYRISNYFSTEITNEIFKK